MGDRCGGGSHSGSISLYSHAKASDGQKFLSEASESQTWSAEQESLVESSVVELLVDVSDDAIWLEADVCPAAAIT